MAEFDSLRKYLVDQVADLLDAERQVLRALPRMADVAATASLRRTFERHSTDTRAHIRRLKRVLAHLRASADSKRSAGMTALLDRSWTMTGDAAEGPIRDAVLIASARQVEQYEIAAYGTARAFAQVLGLPSVMRLLGQTLKEELSTDQALTRIAEESVYDAAAAEWTAELVWRKSSSSRAASPTRTSTRSSTRRIHR